MAATHIGREVSASDTSAHLRLCTLWLFVGECPASTGDAHSIIGWSWQSGHQLRATYAATQRTARVRCVLMQVGQACSGCRNAGPTISAGAFGEVFPDTHQFGCTIGGSSRNSRAAVMHSGGASRRPPPSGISARRPMSDTPSGGSSRIPSLVEMHPGGSSRNSLMLVISAGNASRRPSDSGRSSRKPSCWQLIRGRGSRPATGFDMHSG